MTQFFLVLKACSHNVFVHCMRDVFLISGSKIAMVKFQAVLGTISKVKKARHTSELQQGLYNPKVSWETQKKSPTGVLSRKCSENMQQIYRRTPMPKCNFNKVALQLCWNHFSTSVFSWKLLHIFTVLRIPHRKVASGKERNEKRLKEQIRRQTKFTLV